MNGSKFSFIFLGVFGAVSVFCSFASADVLDLKENQVKLLEFTVDATTTDVRTLAHCSESEVAAATWNMISFDPHHDTSNRDLVASHYPLENKASWHIDPIKCPGMGQYLNGIGFASYDATSGEAVIYLSAFNRKPINENAWNQSGGDGYARMHLFFQPEFDMINEHLFPAKCELTYPSIKSRLGYSDPEFVCTLANAKGSLRFAVQKK